MTIITGLDTETTGLKVDDGHRIIEVCFSMYDLDARKHLATWTKRIHPHRSIHADAQRVHGISIEDLVGCPDWKEVAPIISRIMEKSDILVAHNANFDMPFVATELIRVGIDAPNAEIFCTMESGRWSTPNGKLPKLQELCFSLGVEYDQSEAHAASYDVAVMMECMWRGIDRGFYTLPEIEAQEKVA